MTTSENEQKVNVGVDVSKATLDMYIHETAETMQFGNNQKGIKSAIEMLSKRQIRLVVMESTSMYHLDLMDGLFDAEIPLKVANAKQMKDYARAVRKLAKTDSIDAKIIADFASKMCDTPTTRRESGVEELAELVKRRKQLVNLVVIEKQHAESTRNKEISKGIERMISEIEKEVEVVETQITNCLAENSKLQAKYELIKEIQGVGEVTATTLVATMPELGTLNRTKIAALAGLAPYNNDSGKSSKKRFIKGGRFDIRTCLYMATLCATRYNPEIKIFYKRLINSGKMKKVAITAAMRKLLIIINATVRDGVYDQNKRNILPTIA